MAEHSQVWFLIREEPLLKALRRAHEGESPDMVLMELTANSRYYEAGND